MEAPNTNQRDENCEKALTNLLQKEYDKCKEKYGNGPKNLSDCRRDVMLRIRCTLVKNPYDTGGRILAIEAKNLFIKNVLQEKKWLYFVLDHIRIPKWIKKRRMYNNTLVYFPVTWAIISILRGAMIYSYDIYTDLAVIERIRVTKDNFTIPDISQFDENFTVVQKFVINVAEYPGASSLREPCVPLQHVENVLRSAPIGYNEIFYNLGNVRLLGNDSYHDASDVSQFLVNIANVGKDMNIFSQATRKFLKTEGSSNLFPLEHLPKKINELLKKLTEKIPEKSLGTWLVGANKDIDFANFVLDGVRIIWNNIETNVLRLPLSKTMIRNIDQSWEARKDLYPTDSEAVEPFIKLLEDMAIVLNKDYIQNKLNVSMLPQPDPYAESQHFNETQKFCRKYVNEVFKLFQCMDENCNGEEYKKTLRSTVKEIFTNRKRYSSFDHATSSQMRHTKVSTTYVFNCIRLYLAFLLGFTLLRECYTCFIDMKRYNIIPIKTRLESIQMELTNTSKMFSKAPMNNKEVLINATRFDSNINEAIFETLGAVCIQIALFMYLNTIIFSFQDVWNATIKQSNVTNPSNYAVSIEKFNLTEESIIFDKSPIL